MTNIHDLLLRAKLASTGDDLYSELAGALQERAAAAARMHRRATQAEGAMEKAQRTERATIASLHHAASMVGEFSSDLTRALAGARIDMEPDSVLPHSQVGEKWWEHTRDWVDQFGQKAPLWKLTTSHRRNIKALIMRNASSIKTDMLHDALAGSGEHIEAIRATPATVFAESSPLMRALIELENRS